MVKPRVSAPISTGELLMTPALPIDGGPVTTSLERKEVTGWPRSEGLQAILDDQRRKAEAVQIDAATLAGWYVQQVEAVEAHVRRLTEAMRQLEPALTSPAEGPWEKYWLLDARYRYSADSRDGRFPGTLALLKERGHVLVCANHGIAGVGDLAEADYEGLSLRGIVTGEGALAWSRYCEKCQMGAGIQTMARELRRQHEEMTG